MRATAYLLIRAQAWIRRRIARVRTRRQLAASLREFNRQQADPEYRARMDRLRAEYKAREPERAAYQEVQRAAWARLPCPLIGPWPQDGPSRIPEQSGPPKSSVDPRSPRIWDEWWKNRFVASWPPHELSHYYEVVGPLLPFLRGRPSPRVLSAACGVSLEVRAFAAAGFHCTGLDISPFAVKFAREFIPREGLEWPGSFLRHEDFRDGGTCDWVVGDVLDGSICAGPYDAIVVRNYLQYCWPAGVLDEALMRLKERLLPDGVLVVTSHGNIPAWRAIEDAVLRNGFAWQWNVRLGNGETVPSPPPCHQLAVLAGSTG